MQFSLKSLLIAVTLAGVAAFLVVTVPAKAAIAFASLLAATLFAVFARKQFPRTAKVFGVGTALLFLYQVSDGLLIAMRPVVLRAANPSDEVREKYFCIVPMPEMTTRNIVVVEGTFAKDTWLTGVLYLVRLGKIHELNGFTVGRSPNRIGEPEWIGMRMTMALADAKNKKKASGRSTQLGVTGQTRGGGSGGGDAIHNVAVTSAKAFPGKMVRGQMRIVYVEGDGEATVTPEMSIEDFAKNNAGNFLVVVAGLER